MTHVYGAKNSELRLDGLLSCHVGQLINTCHQHISFLTLPTFFMLLVTVLRCLHPYSGTLSAKARVLYQSVQVPFIPQRGWVSSNVTGAVDESANFKHDIFLYVSAAAVVIISISSWQLLYPHDPQGVGTWVRSSRCDFFFILFPELYKNNFLHRHQLTGGSIKTSLLLSHKMNTTFSRPSLHQLCLDGGVQRT